MALSTNFGIKLSQTSPAFLNANSTSHTWPFSAFAELIDNAYDPDVHATKLSISVKEINNKTCFVLIDDGFGMNPDKLHKMLSFGYCDKLEVNGIKPVGHYGNGFKSGSMRLGKDALVFTKSTQKTISIGMLSQTYLKAINANTILVPIVTWNAFSKEIIESEDSKSSLEHLVKYSLFSSVDSLLEAFSDLDPQKSGTKIIIYNLKRGADDRLELDTDSLKNDILNPEHQELDCQIGLRPVTEYMPLYRKSLREYCSVLYLKPRLKIILRGKKVKTKLLSKSLGNTEIDFYKPLWLDKPMKIVFGFNTNKLDYGVMFYHHNRLIKAYEKVGIQKQNNESGKPVVGIVEVDFLEPIHNKQDFNKTDRYNACINALGIKLNDYYNEKTFGTSSENKQESVPDWTWVQCDSCVKWRRMPSSVDPDQLPETWFCYMSIDPIHNRCEIPEEPEDEDELFRPSYQKTYKTTKTRQRRSELKQQQEKEALEKARKETRPQLENAMKELEQQRQVIEHLRSQKGSIEQQQNNLRVKLFNSGMINKSRAKRPKQQTFEDSELEHLNFVVTENVEDIEVISSPETTPQPNKRRKKRGGEVITIDEDNQDDDLIFIGCTPAIKNEVTNIVPETKQNSEFVVGEQLQVKLELPDADEGNANLQEQIHEIIPSISDTENVSLLSSYSMGHSLNGQLDQNSLPQEVQLMGMPQKVKTTLVHSPKNSKLDGNISDALLQEQPYLTDLDIAGAETPDKSSESLSYCNTKKKTKDLVSPSKQTRSSKNRKATKDFTEQNVEESGVDSSHESVTSEVGFESPSPAPSLTEQHLNIINDPEETVSLTDKCVSSCGDKLDSLSKRNTSIPKSPIKKHSAVDKSISPQSSARLKPNTKTKSVTRVLKDRNEKEQDRRSDFSSEVSDFAASDTYSTTQSGDDTDTQNSDTQTSDIIGERLSDMSVPQSSTSQSPADQGESEDIKIPVKICEQTDKVTNNHMLCCKQLEQTEKTLHNLRVKVSELLKVIVPDLNLGELKNIDEIVTEMIRVNKPDDNQNTNQGSTKSKTKDTVLED